MSDKKDKWTTFRTLTEVCKPLMGTFSTFQVDWEMILCLLILILSLFESIFLYHKGLSLQSCKYEQKFYNWILQEITALEDEGSRSEGRWRSKTNRRPLRRNNGSDSHFHAQLTQLWAPTPAAMSDSIMHRLLRLKGPDHQVWGSSYEKVGDTTCWT